MTTLTPTELEILTPAISATLPGWIFDREGEYLTAWKEPWKHVYIGGKCPEPLRAKTAQGLADRMMLYEAGRLMLRRNNEQEN